LRVREFVPLLVQILASIRSIVSREPVAVVLTRSRTSSTKKLRAIPSRIGARLPKHPTISFCSACIADRPGERAAVLPSRYRFSNGQRSAFSWMEPISALTMADLRVGQWLPRSAITPNHSMIAIRRARQIAIALLALAQEHDQDNEGNRDSN
jgi:hypothetical protein